MSWSIVRYVREQETRRKGSIDASQNDTRSRDLVTAVTCDNRCCPRAAVLIYFLCRALRHCISVRQRVTSECKY